MKTKLLQKPSESSLSIYKCNFPKVTLLLLCCIAVLNLTCKDEPTKPTDITKNPREYTWTCDTLVYPGSWQIAMRGMWASSATDIYIVGHTDGPGPASMFHYDGKSWSTTKFHSGNGGSIQGAVSLSKVYGFGPNDVWVVGEQIYNDNSDSSFIMHYDGSQWRESPIHRGRALQAVWGIAPNDVWAAGLEGTFYHFDGLTWTKLSPFTDTWFADISGLSSTQVYAISYDTINRFFWQWNGSRWNLEESFIQLPWIEPKFGGWDLFSLEGKLLSCGQGVFEKTTTGWSRIFVGGDYYFFRIYGTAIENLFVVGDFGNAYHYNGADWFQYTQLLNQDILYTDCWTDGKEAFVLGNDGLKTYIFHGK